MSKSKRKKGGYTLAGNLAAAGMVVLVILILGFLSGCGADMPAAPSVSSEPVQSEPQRPVTPPETPKEPQKPSAEPTPGTEPEKPAAEPTPNPEPEKPAAEPTPVPESEKPAAEPIPAPEPEKPAAEPAPTPEPEPEQEKGPMVIGNKNSKKYHELGCSSITDMKESNRIEIESAAVAEAKGYKPCARCH